MQMIKRLTELKKIEKVQEKILRNVKTKLSKENQTELDKPFSSCPTTKAQP